MITKKINNIVFAWNPEAFKGKGYWFRLGKNGGLGLAASKAESLKLGIPKKEKSVNQDRSDEYENAQEIRSKGLFGNITENLVSGMSIGQSFGRGIKDTVKAKLTGIKETFDPINIGKKLGGNLGAALVGKITGRSAKDIGYFTGIKVPGLLGKSEEESSLVNVANSLHTNVSESQRKKLQKDDSVADVASKLYNAVKRSYEEKKLRKELERDFSQEKHDRAERRHKELIKEIEKQNQEQKKAEEQLKKEEKKKLKEQQTAKPQGKEPATPSSTSASTAAKVGEAATTSTASTATRIGVGALAATGTISAAAALSIKRETGKSSEKAIENVGQIVPNDPEPGYFSYGIFGLNSKAKTIDQFIAQNPQLGFKEKPGTKAFNDEWTSMAKSKPKEMLDAQISWYDSNITQPLKKDLNRELPSKIANDDRVITYISDRRIQYGRTMEKDAFKYASSADTPEDFIAKMTEFDLKNIGKAFTTYLKNHPGAEKGLINRIKNREKESLSVQNSTAIAPPVPAKVDTGITLGKESTKNTDMKKSVKNTNVLVNNNTTILGMDQTKKPTVLTSPTPLDLPAYQQV